MSLPEAADQLPKLEQYELCEEIGHGGMATVYRAKDPRLGREVAVKIIHRHLRDNGEVAARFVAEARAAAKLKHKGIVEVYDVSREEDREQYLVAELIRGVTLRKVLLEHRDMPAEIGAAIVAELCEAVEHAHEAGIVHRDIKPENVLVELPSDRAAAAARSGPSSRDGERTSGNETPSSHARSGATTGDDDVVDEQASSAPRAVDRAGARPRTNPDDDTRSAVTPTPGLSADDVPGGASIAEGGSDRPSGRSKAPRSGKADGRVVIKLTDFGIAKVLDAQGVTSTGQVLGSPAHMAPEQIEGGEVDIRTDVFALGVLLYECMVGHLPFEGKNPAQVLRRVIEGTFSPADNERPTVGTRFGEIVARALATSAEDRTASPALLGAELRKELEELGLDAPPVEIAAYFADPEKYREELPKRIVPKLVARGEMARRLKQIPLAASDFNRAHALAPGDPSILKRITALSSARGRARMMKRVAALAVGAVAIGGITDGIVRVSRLYGAKLSTNEAEPKLGNPDGHEAPVMFGHEDAHAPRSTAAPSESPKHIAAIPRLATSIDIGPHAPVATPRKVRFAVTPMGAKLAVEGAPVEAFGSTLTLPVGSHAYVLSPLPGETCCEEVRSAFDVPAAPKDKPDEVWVQPLALKPLPATVELVGPAGSMVVCAPFGQLGAGVSKQVRMASVDWSGNCTFTNVDKTVTGAVSIRAGKSNQIAWPG